MVSLAAGAVTPQEITIFLLSLGLLLGLARLLGEAARRLGQPTVLGEIIAGVILGKTVLAGVSPDLYAFLFPEYVETELTSGDTYERASHLKIAMDMFLTLCVALLLLIAGLEVDLSSVWRQGKAALSVSLAGMVVPFVVGAGAVYGVLVATGIADTELGKGANGDTLTFALFVGIAMSITALPVIAKILMDLNMIKSDLGTLIMSAAMVNDLLGWVGFAMVLAMIAGDASGATAGASAGGSLGMTIGLTLLFVGLMLTVGKWLAHRTLPFVQAHTQWPGGVLAFVLVTSLFCAAFTEWIGIHSIFGAFIAGIALGDSAHLRERTRDTIEQFVTNFFAPVFFASIGLRVNFLESFDIMLVGGVLAVAIFGKLFGCWAGARIVGMNSRESWATGFGMCARGAMEIILAQLALDAGLITNELFVAIVVMALVTSLFPGPAMQKLLRRPQQRRFADLLTSKSYLPNLEATTAEDAIRQMGLAAAKLAKLNESDVVDEVLRREDIVSTGLPGGLAVPHGRLAAIKEPMVLLARCPDGVDFNSPDGKPAQLICLILTPIEDASAQIEILDLFARAFHKDAVRDEALGATTYTHLLAVLEVTAENEVAHA